MGFLIVSLIDTPSGLVRQWEKISHDEWKSIIYKYEVLDDKQESLNEIRNRWNNFNIKDTSLDPYIWFNAMYNLNLRFKNIKAKYEKYK